MLDNLILSLNIVLPLLLVMVVGYVTRGMGMMNEKTVTQMNNVTFRVFLPIMLMNNIRSASLGQAVGYSALAFAIAMIVLLYVILVNVVPHFVPERRRCGAVVHALFRSNYALFGTAVLSSLYPGEVLTIPALMISASVPVYNVLAVVCLETFRGGKADVATLLKKIVRNPLIIGCVTGLVLMALGNPLPAFADKTLKDLGGVATTVALFCLGASFRLDALKGNGKVLASVTFIKLVVIPIVFLLPSVLIGYRGQALGSLLIAFGGPVAVSSFTMAQQMDSDGDLAGQLVITTTLFSVLTIFVFIFVMKTMGLL